MQIAICDNDDRFCSMIERLLYTFGHKNMINVDISIYNTGEYLLHNMTNGIWFDMVFLDINLPGICGITVADNIRNRLNNLSTCIVFISKNTDRCMELFDYQPLNFHIKPFGINTIASDMKKAVKSLKLTDNIFRYKSFGAVKHINYSDILYFSSQDKCIYINTKDYSDKFRGNLTNMENSLSKSRFLRCHKSFIVNLRHIQAYHYNEITMDNRELIPIGRHYRENVMDVLVQYE